LIRRQVKLLVCFTHGLTGGNSILLSTGAHIVGLTAIGRAAVRVLNMNDKERIDLRAELIELNLLG